MEAEEAEKQLLKAMRFGTLLKAMREDAGVSRKAFASSITDFLGSLWNMREEDGFDVGALDQRIGRWESSKQNDFTPDYLYAMAHALRLTMAEQSLFYTSAIQPRTPSVGTHYRTVYHDLAEAVRTIRTPAVVFDQLGNIVCANTLIMQFLDISPTTLQSLVGNPVRFHVLRVIFDPTMQYRTLVTEQRWAKSALSNVAFFRSLSVPYRATEAYQAIVTALSDRKLSYGPRANYDTFNRLIRADPGGIRDASGTERYEYRRNGHTLAYLANVSENHTGHLCGNLYLAIYTPLNAVTAQLFQAVWNELEQQHANRVYHLAPWPWYGEPCERSSV